MFRAILSVSVPIVLSFSLSLCLLACDPDHGGDGPEGSGFQSDFPSARSLNARLGKGINLGNALDAPTEGDWGVTLKADYFRRIADSGFTSVRIPARFSGHALAAGPYTIDTEFMNRVAWAVDEALKNKLLVVLDMHHYDALMAKPVAEFPRFLSMWKQIAKRFGDYPPELLFELVNEPRERLDAPTWNGILSIVIDTLRAAQPRRALVVGTTPWGGIAGLGELSLPSDTNLIVAVHYYEPHNFTHQGASFETGADEWLGTLWRATPAQRAFMDQDLDYVRDWAREHDRPVYFGEYGSIVRADSVSRALYTEYLSRKFDTAGFSSALWNYSSDFGIVNDTTDAWNGYLSDAILHHGRNPKLDSILAATKAIDLATYVTFDDFEDDIPRLPASARHWRESQGIALTHGGADWYAFTSDSSEIKSGSGTHIRNYKEVDSGQAPNFDLLMGPGGSQGQGLHAKVHLFGGNYPYAGIGGGILGGWDSTFADLTKLTAIQFRAKGEGEWLMQVVSDSVASTPPPNDWGHMTYVFRPKADWETYLVPAEALAPKRYSRQEKQHLTWEDVRKKIISLEFMNGQSYGETPDTTLELWIDDIRLIGVTNADLGM